MVEKMEEFRDIFTQILVKK